MKTDNWSREIYAKFGIVPRRDGGPGSGPRAGGGGAGKGAKAYAAALDKYFTTEIRSPEYASVAKEYNKVWAKTPNDVRRSVEADWKAKNQKGGAGEKSLDLSKKVKGTDFTGAELAEKAKSGGKDLFGKDLVFDKPTAITREKLSKIIKNKEEGQDYVDEFEYVFKPSTGKGMDVSSTEWKKASSKWADTDGKIYTYSSTDNTIRVIDVDVKLKK